MNKVQLISGGLFVLLLVVSFIVTALDDKNVGETQNTISVSENETDAEGAVVPAGEQVEITERDYFCTNAAFECSNFATQEEAQDMFILCGGSSNDIHNLDPDNDGVAC